MTRKLFTLVAVWSALVLSSAIAMPARGACKLHDDVMAARKNAEDAFKEYHAIKLDPVIENKVVVFEGLRTLDPDIDYADVEKMRGNTLNETEKKALREYFTRQKQARVKLDAANAAAQGAEQAWRDKFNKKEELLGNADKIFREDHAWLEKERAALGGMEVNSPEYLDRASKVTERLKDSYAGIQANLEPYRDCFTDVNTFLKDIEERLKRIKRLDDDIAARRAKTPAAGVPGVTTLHPDRPSDATLKPGVTAPDNTDQNARPALNPKYGDVWVWDGNGPEVKVMGDTRNLLVSKDANGASWKVTSDDGTKTGIAGCKITMAPRQWLQAGEPVEVRMTAYGQDPAAAWGGVYADNFGGGGPWEGHNGGDCRSNEKPEAVWRSHFYVPDGAEKRSIEARMWRPVSGGYQDPSVWIIWTYVREGGKK